MTDLHGKRIVVTGAAGALGKAAVAVLAGAGAQVIAVDTADGIPDAGQADSRAGIDLADAGTVARLFDDIGAEPLDGLVNIAGGFAFETIADGGGSAWDTMQRANLMTAVACCRAAIPALKRGGGAIVNIGANAVRKAGAGMGAYTASKAGVHKLTEALADELKGDGVRVNAVLPQTLDTPANRKDMPDADVSTWVTTEALAGVIAFLLSDAAAPITGALIPVTGKA